MNFKEWLNDNPEIKRHSFGCTIKFYSKKAFNDATEAAKPKWKPIDDKAKSGKQIYLRHTDFQTEIYTGRLVKYTFMNNPCWTIKSRFYDRDLSFYVFNEYMEIPE
jgi:hypothetical protein